MGTNKKLINEEIHRIREMMGLNLINEISGSGILDELVAIFKKTPKAADEVADITKINKGNIRGTISGLATKNPKMFKSIMNELVNKLDSQLQKDVKDVFNYVSTSKSAGDDYKVFEQQYEQILKSQGVQDEVLDLFKKDLEMKWNETPTGKSSVPTQPITQTMSTEKLQEMFEDALNNKSITVDENLGIVINRDQLAAQLKIRTGASESVINKQLDLLEKAMPKTDDQVRTLVESIAKELQIKVNTEKINKKEFLKLLKGLIKKNWGVKIIAGILAFYATAKLTRGVLWLFGEEDSGAYALISLLGLEPGSIDLVKERLMGIRKKESTQQQGETQQQGGTEKEDSKEKKKGKYD